MRLKGLMALGLSAALATACGDSTGITVEDLVGTWSATLIEYTDNATGTLQVNLIAEDGASLVMTVTADGTASTVFNDGLGGTSSDSGTLSSSGTTLTISGETFQAERSGDVLTLTDETNEYDFDENGSDDPATLVIRMVRQ